MIEENVKFELEDNLFDALLLYKNKDTFIDDKERIKIIKNIESMIRSSNEYKYLVKYIKNTANMNKCSILDNISDEEVTIDVHHCVYTLFDIVDIIIKKYENRNDYWNAFVIADKVLELHYSNCIGLIPLSRTMHEFIHSNNIIINDKKMIGDIDLFYDLYNDVMSEEQLEKYEIYTNSNITLDDIKNSIILK